MVEEEIQFPEIPVLVVHDTVISDVLGETEVTRYKDSAIFITNYFLTRQAVIGITSEKSGITTTQVFRELEKDFEKSNTFKMIKDWIDEEPLTEKLPLSMRSSIYVLPHFLGRRNEARTGRRVILVCNDENINEKLIVFYKDSPWQVKIGRASCRERV